MGRDLFAQTNTGRDLFAQEQPGLKQQPFSALKGRGFLNNSDLYIPTDQMSSGPLGRPQDTEIEKSIKQEVGEPGILRTGAISTGRGLAKIGRALGLANVSDIFAPESEAEKIAFGELEKQRPIITMIGEAVGESLPFAPIGGPISGIASKIARPLAAAGVGATEAALIRRGEGEGIGEQAKSAGIGGLAAGATESIVPVLSRIGGKIIRRVTGKAPKGALISAEGAIAPELELALSKSGLTIGDLTEATQEAIQLEGKNLDPSQLARKGFLESEGLSPTRAQVTRGATDFQQQQELAKVSGKVGSALETQEGILANKFDATVKGTGGEAVTSGAPVIDHVLNKSTKLDNEISDLYQVARERSLTVGKTGRIQELKSELIEINKRIAAEPKPEKVIDANQTFKELQQAKEIGIMQQVQESKEGWTERIAKDYKRKFGKDAPIIETKKAGASGLSQRKTEISEMLSGKRPIPQPEIGTAAKVVKPSSTLSVLKQMQSSNTLMKGVPESIKGELVGIGVIDKDFNILRNMTVDEAESNIRQVANTMFSSTSDFGKIGIRKIKNAVDEDVTKSAGEDIFRQARKAKATFERDLNTSKVSKFDKRGKNIVRDILENKVDADRFLDQVVLSKADGRRASDLAEIKRYLHTGTEPEKVAGKQAWDDLRAETMDWIKNNSFIGPEDAQGYKALSRAKLESSIKKIGRGKIGVLFDEKERDFLKRMLQVSKIREPVRGTALGKGPSAQAIEGLVKLAEKIPIVGTFAKDWDISMRGSAALRARPEAMKTPLLTIRKPQIGGVSGAFVAPLAVGAEEERINRNE